MNIQTKNTDIKSDITGHRGGYVGHDLECFTKECLRARKKRKAIQKLAEKSCYPSQAKRLQAIVALYTSSK